MILNYNTLEELNQSRTPTRHPAQWVYKPPNSSNKAKAKVERKSSSPRKRPIRTKREPSYLKDFNIDSPKTPIKKRRKYL